MAYSRRNHENPSPTEPTDDGASSVSLRRWSWSESDRDDPDECIPRPRSQSQDIDVTVQREGDNSESLIPMVGFVTESRSQEGQIVSEQITEPEDTLSQEGGLESDLGDSAAQLFSQVNKDETLAKRKGSKVILITARS